MTSLRVHTILQCITLYYKFVLILNLDLMFRSLRDLKCMLHIIIKKKKCKIRLE